MATPTAVRAWQAALNRASAAAASSAAAVNPSTGTKKWRKGRGASLVARGRPVGETREVGSAPGSCEALREGSPHACSIHLRPQRAGCALAPACRTPRHDRGPAAAPHLLLLLLRASCPRIAPPERRGHAPHRQRSRHAHAAAAACCRRRRIGDLSGARLRCDGSGPVWQAPICACYAAQRRAHAAHTPRTPFASDDRHPAAAAPAGAAVRWGGGGGGGGGDGGGGAVGGQR